MPGRGTVTFSEEVVVARRRRVGGPLAKPFLVNVDNAEELTKLAMEQLGGVSQGIVGSRVAAALADEMLDDQQGGAQEAERSGVGLVGALVEVGQVERHGFRGHGGSFLWFLERWSASVGA